MHHEKCDQNLVDGVPEGQHCDHFLVFCPGKPQIRALSNLLIRWQELGYTRGLEVVPMYSGESPETWQYFDRPVSGTKIFGKQMPYYLSSSNFGDMTRMEYVPHHQLLRHTSGRDIGMTVKRYRKVGLTANVKPNGSDPHVCGGGHLDYRGPHVLTEPEVPRRCQLHTDSVDQ